MARARLIQIAVAYDVRVTMSRVADSSEWVVTASREEGARWTATAPDLSQAVTQVQGLMGNSLPLHET